MKHPNQYPRRVLQGGMGNGLIGDLDFDLGLFFKVKLTLIVYNYLN